MIFEQTKREKKKVRTSFKKRVKSDFLKQFMDFYFFVCETIPQTYSAIVFNVLFLIFEKQKGNKGNDVKSDFQKHFMDFYFFVCETTLHTNIPNFLKSFCL